MRPLAHRDALLLQDVGDQLVVFDQRRQRLHVLSRSAALVWRHCDGQRDIAELAGIIGRELGAPVNDEVILLALEQLREAELLSVRGDSTPLGDSVSRREMLSRAMGGLAAGLLLPVVTSCGSIADAVAPVTARSNAGILEVNTTTTSALTTTTSTTGTTPVGTTTTTGTTPFVTTTTSTTGTTTTSTTGTTTTSTTPAPKKVQMCHNGRSIMVDARAVDAHLAQGDTLGPCPG
jgi:hypothetical protein